MLFYLNAPKMKNQHTETRHRIHNFLFTVRHIGFKYKPRYPVNEYDRVWGYLEASHAGPGGEEV